jgi:hypothetical protein
LRASMSATDSPPSIRCITSTAVRREGFSANEPPDLGSCHDDMSERPIIVQAGAGYPFAVSHLSLIAQRAPPCLHSRGGRRSRRGCEFRGCCSGDSFRSLGALTRPGSSAAPTGGQL